MYIIKWCVGDVSKDGLACLDMSISSFKQFYPDAEFHVFFNQIDSSKLEHLIEWGVQIHDQSDYLSSFPIQPLEGYQFHWKLYPPRFNLNVHEISIDNDIVIFDRIKEIDLFLKSSDYTLLYQGLHGIYGSYVNHVPKGMRINSGIFGMPPGFNFIAEMESLNVLDLWKDKWDEQGLVAAVLLKSKNRFIIPLTTVPILEHDFSMDSALNALCCGYHFVGLNYVPNHKCWNKFSNKKIIRLI